MLLLGGYELLVGCIHLIPCILQIAFRGYVGFPEGFYLVIFVYPVIVVYLCIVHSSPCAVHRALGSPYGCLSLLYLLGAGTGPEFVEPCLLELHKGLALFHSQLLCRGVY